MNTFAKLSRHVGGEFRHKEPGPSASDSRPLAAFSPLPTLSFRDEARRWSRRGVHEASWVRNDVDTAVCGCPEARGAALDAIAVKVARGTVSAQAV